MKTDVLRCDVSQEAVRVSTPPWDEDTADGKPRAFFMSMTPPESDTAGHPSNTPSVTRSNHHIYGHHRCSLSRPREWWDPMPCPRSRQKPQPSQGFVFDVPEHLPSSPLCPANRRHKSGRTGLCVYHGRSRAADSNMSETNRVNN